MNMSLLSARLCRAESFFQDFISDEWERKRDDYLDTQRSYELPLDDIGELSAFPVYLGHYRRHDPIAERAKKQDFILMGETVAREYAEIDRSLLFNKMFWLTVFCYYHRDYLVAQYPVITENVTQCRDLLNKAFLNAFKSSYIQKAVVAALYVRSARPGQLMYYLEQFHMHQDIVNSMLKISIFSNPPLFCNILDIIRETGTALEFGKSSKYLKDCMLRKEIRMGRYILGEMNLSYPVLMIPMLSYEQLKQEYLRRLNQLQQCEADYLRSLAAGSPPRVQAEA